MQRGMQAVLKISSSHFLFILEVLVVSVGIAIFFFIQNRKLKSAQNYAKKSSEKIQKEPQSESIEKTQKETQNESVEKMQDELQKQAQEIAETSELKENLQHNFDQIKNVNIKLKGLVGSIVPEPDRSEDMQKILSDTALSKQDLDACIGKVKEEIKGIVEQVASNAKEGKSHEKEVETQKEELTQLKRKLENSVKKATYESMKTEKDRLEFKLEQVEKHLKEKTEEFEKMEKEHAWLEDEYNRMYDNLEAEEERHPDQAPAGQPAEG
jgi:chromosome segregation ATPase